MILNNLSAVKIPKQNFHKFKLTNINSEKQIEAIQQKENNVGRERSSLGNSVC